MVPEGAPPHFRAIILALMTELFLIGLSVAIYLILALICLRFILFHMNRRPNNKSRNVLLTFMITSIVALATDFIGIYSGYTVFVLCALDSDKPLSRCNNAGVDKSAFRRDVVVTVAEVVLYILADGMLYYRSIIIWQRKIWIVCLGGILFLAAEVLLLYSEIVGFFGQSGANFIINDVSIWISAFYDTCLSSLIIGRLIHYRRNAKVAGAGSESISVYTSLVTVFVEASFLVTATRVQFAVMQLTKRLELGAFWSVILLDLGAAISPLCIILRLALNSFKDPYERYEAVKRPNAMHAESNMAFASRRGPRRPSVLKTIIMGTTSGIEDIDDIDNGGISIPTVTSEPTVLPTESIFSSREDDKV